MATSTDILTLAQEFRQLMLASDRATMQRLAVSYNTIWVQAREALAELTADMETARAKGEEVDALWLFQQQRYTDLIAQVEAALEQYVELAAEDTADYQRQLAEQAQTATGELMRAQSARISVRTLPRGAINELVGIMGDGSPLNTILQELVQQGVGGMREALTSGVALGWNPAKIAEAARGGMGQSLGRAMTVARTEGLRAYRTTQMESMKANQSLLSGWYWLSAADARTCPSCWAMLHAVGERLNDHPNGRCAAVPAVKGFRLNIPSGEERFAALDADTQQIILGADRYAAFADGKITLRDMVQTHQSAAWGSHRRAATAQEAISNARA